MVRTTDVKVSAAREHVPNLIILVHMFFIETFQLSLIQIPKPFPRNVDDVPIFVVPLFCHFVDLLLPAPTGVDRNGPMQDIDSIESFIRDMIARVVRKALIA